MKARIYTCRTCHREEMGVRHKPQDESLSWKTEWWDPPSGWIEFSLVFPFNHLYTWRCPDCAPAASETFRTLFGWQISQGAPEPWREITEDEFRKRTDARRG